MDVRFRAKETTTGDHLEQADGGLPRAGEEFYSGKGLDSFAFKPSGGEQNQNIEKKSLMGLLASIRQISGLN